MQSSVTNKLLLTLAACLLLSSTEARAEWGLGVSGNVGSGFSYTRERQGDTVTWTTARTDNYTLGLSGKVLDRRLATFNISSALSMSDFSSNQKSGAEDPRLLSFAGNLSILPGKPYPLDLRLSQSHLSSGTDTDTLAFGGSWRITYGALPAIFLNFDRVNIQSTGRTSSDTTFTTGTLRLSKRLFSSDLDAEFGLQNFADDIRGTSTLRHFGRFSGTTAYSPATTLRFTGDYFSQEDNRSLGSIFSMINRPDPTLSRSLSVGIRNLTGKNQEQTTLDANGAFSKAFRPFDSLAITPFARALLSQQFASDGLGNQTLLNWSLGSSLVSRYFRSVLISSDYGLGLSYDNQEAGETSLGTTQQIHVGLESRTLYPYRVRGDYTLTLERTLTERTRQLASLRANGPLSRTLHFRSYAELLDEDAEFSSLQTTISAEQRSLTFGGGLTYTGIDQLYFDLGANLQQMDTDNSSSWLSRLTANLNYRPRSGITVTLNGLRETDTLNELTRYEISPRVIYQFGQATINFEYRFETRESFGQPGEGHSVSIRINRPFRFSF